MSVYRLILAEEQNNRYASWSHHCGSDTSICPKCQFQSWLLASDLAPCRCSWESQVLSVPQWQTQMELLVPNQGLAHCIVNQQMLSLSLCLVCVCPSVSLPFK